MSTRSASVQHAADTDNPETRAAFGRVKLLVGLYATISALAVVAIVLLRHHAADVNSAVWTHGVIVLASALLTLSVTSRAARGARRAFLRLRIISTVLVVAIAVILALPGSFPLWMKAEQGVCGLLMLGVVVLVNGRQLRSSFAGR